MTSQRLARLPQVLFEIGKAIGSDEGLGPLLDHISELMCELVGGDAVSIMLLDRERQRLLAKAAHGLDSDLTKISFAVGEGVAGWVAERGESALISDAADDPRFVHRDGESAIRSLVCVPLIARGECAGVLTATTSRPNAFEVDHVELLEFVAKTIALDMENIRLRKLSVTDPLTGCYNREFLHRQLPIALTDAAGRNQPLAVAMIDVDHFKSVNDRFGHDVGDDVLANVAARLRGAIRGDDFLVRYGGEEFLVVLPNADADHAREVGERMRRTMQGEAFTARGQPVEIRISVGVAEFRPGAETADLLIRRADTALYTAKGHGRNRVELAR